MTLETAVLPSRVQNSTYVHSRGKYDNFQAQLLNPSRRQTKYERILFQGALVPASVLTSN